MNSNEEKSKYQKEADNDSLQEIDLKKLNDSKDQKISKEIFINKSENENNKSKLKSSLAFNINLAEEVSNLIKDKNLKFIKKRKMSDDFIINRKAKENKIEKIMEDWKNFPIA